VRTGRGRERRGEGGGGEGMGGEEAGSAPQAKACPQNYFAGAGTGPVE